MKTSLSAYPDRDQIDKWKRNFPELTIIRVVREMVVQVASLDSAMIIFHAEWSGPSYIRIETILKTLKGIGTRIKIYIVNIDKVSIDFVEAILGGLCQGYGESVYYMDSRIVAKYAQQREFAAFIDFLNKSIRG
jgi:hypothetical protein